MKELQTILETHSALNAGKNAVLATVVDVQGSSYRLPGARMLIDESGKSVGTVSGGCLEADVLERAKKVLVNNVPTVITYDTTQNEDSVFGLGMGCRGVVRILLEAASDNRLFEFWRECFERRTRGAIATLISTVEDFPLPLGARVFMRSEENFEMTFDRVNFQIKDFLQTFLTDTFAALSENCSGAKIYESERGSPEFFIEVINPPISLLLFGAGYDALPVANFAKNLGWRVSVIDHRAAWANAERFASADEIIVSGVEDLDANLFADENSVAVIMTHNYECDREILRRLLGSSVSYIGALGPKKRTERLLAEIGEKFYGKQLVKVYAPVGLDIGAETPEEIALAIIAEIQTVLANRQGGFLRERDGGIH
ncbi:MAG: XdhC family protein [Pyrinomonadaceae bacterium]